MSHSDDRVLRLPWLGHFSTLLLLVIGFVGYGLYAESESKSTPDTDALFDPNATVSDRMRSAEHWVNRGSDAVGPMIAALEHEDSRTRSYAALVLGRIGEPAISAVPALMNACGDSTPRVRGNALYALYILSDDREEVCRQAVRRLDDPAPFVFDTAQEVLRRSKSAALPELLQATRHESAGVRRNAVLLLCDVNAQLPAVLDVIRLYRADPDDEVRAAALCALHRAGELSVADCVAALSDSDERILNLGLTAAWDARSPGAEAAVPALTKLLNRRYEPQTLVLALRKLAELEHLATVAVPQVVELTVSRYAPVRIAAAEALVSIGTDANQLTDILKQLIVDTDPNATLAAGRLWRKLPADCEEELIEKLQQRLADPSQSVRRSAAAALCGLGPSAARAVDDLTVALGDDDSEVRRWVIRSLAATRVASPFVTQSLLARLRDSRETVENRIEVVVALRRFGKVSAQILPELLTHSAHSQTPTRLRAESLRTLSLLAPETPQVADVILAAAMNGESRLLQATAVELLPQLKLPVERVIPVLQDALIEDSVRVRIAACAAVIQLGPSAEPMVGDLVVLLGDEDPLMHLLGCRGLQAVGPSALEAVPILLEVAEAPESRDKWHEASVFTDDMGTAHRRPYGVRHLDLTQHETVAAAAQAALDAIAPQDIKSL